MGHKIVETNGACGLWGSHKAAETKETSHARTETERKCGSESSGDQKDMRIRDCIMGQRSLETNNICVGYVWTVEGYMIVETKRRCDSERIRDPKSQDQRSTHSS